MINRHTVEPTALVLDKKRAHEGGKKKPLTVLNIQIRVQHALSPLNCDNIY